MVLVNNAGLALGTDAVYANSIKDAKTVMDTNVLGVTAFCSAFIPGMLQRQQGHIVNVGSVAGHHAYKNGSVYNASKFAIKGFTEAAMVKFHPTILSSAFRLPPNLTLYKRTLTLILIPRHAHYQNWMNS